VAALGLGALLHADAAAPLTPTAAASTPASMPGAMATALATPAATAQATPLTATVSTPQATPPSTPVASVAVTETAAPLAVPPAADAEPMALSKAAKALGHAGVTYSIGLANWIVFNASPLAYTPFEMGYDFGNGARAQTGIDIFDYEGNDHDPTGVPGRYSYQMTDWRTSMLYRFPMQSRLRPLVGMTVDVVGGSRSLAPDYEGGVDVNADLPKISSWGYFGCGFQAGLEYLISPDWSVHLNERYDFTFNTYASPIITEFGFMVTF
jgi:hypothetical protein